MMDGQQVPFTCVILQESHPQDWIQPQNRELLKDLCHGILAMYKITFTLKETWK